MKHYRQGDVLIYQVNELKRSYPVTGKAVLAYGEVTGHHHRIEADSAHRFLAYTGEDGTTVSELEVLEAVELLHEEHDTIVIEPGNYKVAIQVEEQVQWHYPRPVLD